MDHRRPLLRSLLLPLVAILLAIAVAACGDDDDADTTADQGSGTTADTSGTDDPYGSPSGDDGGGEAAEGTIVAKDFTLTDLTVAPGEEIVLKNEGDVPHTATADDGEFDLGRVEPGSTSDAGTAPDEAGTYAFHCEIHPNMKATLTVEG